MQLWINLSENGILENIRTVKHLNFTIIYESINIR